MAFTYSPAVQENLVAALEGRIARTFDAAGEVDPRHHGKLTYHRPFACDCKRVFVIERRILDAHRDIACRQLRLIERLDAGAVGLRIFLD